MNKKILNVITPRTQNPNEQNAPKTKAFIINLGTATQLTLGSYGSKSEKIHAPWTPLV